MISGRKLWNVFTDAFYLSETVVWALPVKVNLFCLAMAAIKQIANVEFQVMQFFFFVLKSTLRNDKFRLQAFIDPSLGKDINSSVTSLLFSSNCW